MIYILWSHGIQKPGTGSTANFGNLVPVIALVSSYFALNEDIGLMQAAGAGMTLAGVWIARR